MLLLANVHPFITQKLDVLQVTNHLARITDFVRILAITLVNCGT
jgi:hypothetical protein